MEAQSKYQKIYLADLSGNEKKKKNFKYANEIIEIGKNKHT